MEADMDAEAASEADIAAELDTEMEAEAEGEQQPAGGAGRQAGAAGASAGAAGASAGAAGASAGAAGASAGAAGASAGAAGASAGAAGASAGAAGASAGAAGASAGAAGASAGAAKIGTNPCLNRKGEDLKRCLLQHRVAKSSGDEQLMNSGVSILKGKVNSAVSGLLGPIVAPTGPATGLKQDVGVGVTEIAAKFGPEARMVEALLEKAFKSSLQAESPVQQGECGSCWSVLDTMRPVRSASLVLTLLS